MKTKFTFAGLLAICLALAGCDTAPDASDDAHAETTKAVVESTQHAVTLLGQGSYTGLNTTVSAQLPAQVAPSEVVMGAVERLQLFDGTRVEGASVFSTEGVFAQPFVDLLAPWGFELLRP